MIHVRSLVYQRNLETATRVDILNFFAYHETRMLAFTSSLKTLPKSIREITVEIPAAGAETCFAKALRRLSQDLEIAGFRKGKVPLEMAEKHIRADALFEEASHIAIQDTYPNVVQHHRLEPVGKPDISLTKNARGSALAYRVRVAVLGEVELPHWRKIKIKKHNAIPDPAEIEKALNYLQKSRAKFVAAIHPAKLGDFAEVDFTIRQGGVIIENGSAQRYPLTLGEGKLMPGFEENLVGMQVGEEKTFSIAVPADFTDKNLAGKTLEFTVKLISLFDRLLPERDDAFAQSLGKFSTFAEIEKNVADGIRREKEEHETLRARMEIIGKIAEKARMEVPDVLIEREVEKMFQDLEARLAGSGLTLETYLEHLKKTRDELGNDWRGEAEKRVRIALALRAIAKEEQVIPREDEIEAKMQDVVRGHASAADVRKQYSEEALREYAEQLLANEKVFELIERECIIT